MAAVLASGPEAVLSHWSAAALWMIRPNSRTRIDVTVPHRSRSSDLILRHISEVSADERTIEVRKVRLALERLEEEPEGRMRSPLEERFAPFLRQHHLSLPRFNDWIVLGAKRYQVDCHWLELHQVVELDGWEGHGTRTAFREDRARGRRLAAAGYTVTHITWSQLDDEPDAVAADLRALLRRPRRPSRP